MIEERPAIIKKMQNLITLSCLRSYSRIVHIRDKFAYYTNGFIFVKAPCDFQDAQISKDGHLIEAGYPDVSFIVKEAEGALNDRKGKLINVQSLKKLLTVLEAKHDVYVTFSENILVLKCTATGTIAAVTYVRE